MPNLNEILDKLGEDTDVTLTMNRTELRAMFLFLALHGDRIEPPTEEDLASIGPRREYIYKHLVDLFDAIGRDNSRR